MTDRNRGTQPSGKRLFTDDVRWTMTVLRHGAATDASRNTTKKICDRNVLRDFEVPGGLTGTVFSEDCGLKTKRLLTTDRYLYKNCPETTRTKLTTH